MVPGLGVPPVVPAHPALPAVLEPQRPVPAAVHLVVVEVHRVVKPKPSRKKVQTLNNFCFVFGPNHQTGFLPACAHLHMEFLAGGLVTYPWAQAGLARLAIAAA